MTDATSLEGLRRKIDQIDDSIQELLWQRTAVVEKVRAYKHKRRAFQRGGFFRPSREMEILRRLLRRHHGRFPKLAIVQIWRTIIAAHLAHQEHFTLAVYRSQSQAACWDLAQEHYGPVVPITPESSMTTILRKVAAQTVSAGVVPVPQKKDDGWWRHLDGKFDGLQIVAGLPFANFQSGKGKVEALLIAPMPAEKSSKDRSFLVVESEGGIGPARLGAALAREKIDGRFLFTWRSSAGRGPAGRGRSFSLVEVEGFLDGADPVLARIRAHLGPSAQRVGVLGSYAVPIDGTKQRRKPSRERA